MAATAVQTSNPGAWRRLRPHLAALALCAAAGAGLYAFLDHHAGTTIAGRKAALPRIEVRLATAGGDEAPDKENGKGPQASAFIVPEGMNRIALVMTELGLADAPTEKAVLRLPPEVTLSFSVYAERLKFWLEQGTVTQHETLIAAPMEPQSFPKDDPGPKALMARNSVEENRETLRDILESGTGYIGLSNFLGSRFMTDAKKLRPFFEDLKGAGLLFVDTTPDVAPAALESASESGVVYIKGDVTIDRIPTDVAIRDNLRQLETLATRQGYAVGVASPYPVTFDALAEWLPTLRAKNIVLAPISAISAVAGTRTKPPEGDKEGHAGAP